MNAKQAKYPQLRFKGFTDPWEKRNLGDITAWTKGQGLPKEDLNEEKSGLEAVHYADLYKFSPVMHEVIHWTNSDDGRVIPNNSLLFPASDVTPVGLARTSTLKLSGVKAGGDVIIGQLDESIDSSFMSYQINATSKKILPLITGTTVKHVQAKSLATLSVSVTNMAEQTAIAGLFERIHKLIAANQRKLDLLKEQKKGYLQKMFPKNGSKFPQLRFAGFADAWEQRKLGDITKISTGKLDANAMVENGKYDFYTSGIKKYRIDVAAFEGPSITIAGNGATVGYMHLADNKFNAYQRTYVLQEFLVDRSFIFSEIGNKLPKKIKQEARTGNIPYIVMDMLTELKLSIPQNNSEQQKIGSLFKQLDDTIDLHQRKLEKLQELKKGYLQKMFC